MKGSIVATTFLGKQLTMQIVANRRPQYACLYRLSCLQRKMSAPIGIRWDYETERKMFNLRTPDYYNFARDAIDKWAEKEKVLFIVFLLMCTWR